MPTLSQTYIEQHRNTTHTYAAFGKLMIDAILGQAAAILGTSSMDSVTVPLELEVSPFEGSDCIRICVRTADGETWCTNQFADSVYKLD